MDVIVIILLIGHLTIGIVYLIILFCLVQLIPLNLDLTNSGNTEMLFIISKPKLMEPEVGVVIRY